MNASETDARDTLDLRLCLEHFDDVMQGRLPTMQKPLTPKLQRLLFESTLALRTFGTAPEDGYTLRQRIDGINKAVRDVLLLATNDTEDTLLPGGDAAAEASA